MARGQLVAALGTVALAIAAPIAAQADDHATVEPSGLIHWPAAGDWQTLLMKLPNGQPACIFGPKERTLPDGGKFGFTIWVQRASAHLWLNLAGTKTPAPKALVFYADGKPFASLTVAQQLAGAAPGWTSYMADLPGDMLGKQLIPNLTSGNAIELAADGRRYAVPNADFKTTAGYLQECFTRANAMGGAAPE